jgi:hypothetical protein
MILDYAHFGDVVMFDTTFGSWFDEYKDIANTLCVKEMD